MRDEVVRTAGGAFAASAVAANVDIRAGRSGGNTSRPDWKWWQRLAGRPYTPGKHPALLVIQEWWGVTDWIKQDVARFASQGYVALAVDPYRGKVASNPGETHELMRGLPKLKGS